MVADVGANRFPGELRVALHASGLTLEAIQRRLADRGFSIGRSTLSYWQNGRRLPTEAKSLLAVAALEDILKVPAGRFTEALHNPGSQPARSDLDMAASAARIDALMEGVGCPDGLSTMEQINTVAIAEYGPGGGLRIVRNLDTFRALVDTDRYPLIYGGEPGVTRPSSVMKRSAAVGSDASAGTPRPISLSASSSSTESSVAVTSTSSTLSATTTTTRRACCSTRCSPRPEP